MNLRIPSPLDPGLEQVISEVIGACIAVHRELGPGLLETIYHRAVAIELNSRGISHEVERSIPIVFKGELVCHQRLDLIVDERVVVELKSVERLVPLHVAQTISYLRATKLRAALLVNFNVALLKDGIRRIVL